MTGRPIETLATCAKTGGGLLRRNGVMASVFLLRYWRIYTVTCRGIYDSMWWQERYVLSS